MPQWDDTDEARGIAHGWKETTPPDVLKRCKAAQARADRLNASKAAKKKPAAKKPKK